MPCYLCLAPPKPARVAFSGVITTMVPYGGIRNHWPPQTGASVHVSVHVSSVQVLSVHVSVCILTGYEVLTLKFSPINLSRNKTGKLHFFFLWPKWKKQFCWSRGSQLFCATVIHFLVAMIRVRLKWFFAKLILSAILFLTGKKAMAYNFFTWKIIFKHFLLNIFFFFFSLSRETDFSSCVVTHWTSFIFNEFFSLANFLRCLCACFAFLATFIVKYYCFCPLWCLSLFLSLKGLVSILTFSFHRPAFWFRSPKFHLRLGDNRFECPDFSLLARILFVWLSSCS